MGEKSEKHFYTEADVFPLHSLNSPSCINVKTRVSSHLCKSKDAMLSIWKQCNNHIY